jgi:hypothetical protein
MARRIFMTLSTFAAMTRVAYGVFPVGQGVVIAAPPVVPQQHLQYER